MGTKEEEIPFYYVVQWMGHLEELGSVVNLNGMNIHKKLENIDALCIGEALKTNTTLTELDLSNNNITDYGMGAILAALKTNNTLRVLDLRNNKLSETMKSQLNDIEPYKKAGSNGYQQVEEMSIQHYSNKEKLRF